MLPWVAHFTPETTEVDFETIRELASSVESYLTTEVSTSAEPFDPYNAPDIRHIIQAWQEDLYQRMDAVE